MADISKSTTFQISAMLAKWSRKTTPALKSYLVISEEKKFVLAEIKNTQ